MIPNLLGFDEKIQNPYRVTQLYAKGIYARDEHHAMILGFWIETFIFIHVRGVFIQMTLMK